MHVVVVGKTKQNILDIGGIKVRGRGGAKEGSGSAPQSSSADARQLEAR